MAGSQRQRQGRTGGVPAAGRPAAGVHQARRSTTRTSGSRSASRSSAAARRAWPRPTACCSCSADDPETMERLGEVPVAVIEKAKTCGGHNLSGAVVRPGPLEELYPETDARGLAQGGLRLRRGHQGGRLPDADRQASRCASRPPPPFKNHGNEVVSVSALARFQQRLAEEGGAYILTETAATQLLVEDGRVQRRALRRQGPRQGRRAAGQLRARHGHHRAGHGAGRGLLGPPHRRRDPRVRPRRGRASPRSGSSGSRRSGRSPSRWTA